jgi:hypothetical protein
MKRLSALLAAPLLTILASCDAQKPEDVPAPPPSPPEAVAPPPEAPPPADPQAPPSNSAADPASAPQAPAQPAPAAPPPTEPSPAPTPTAAQGPPLESMSLATPPAKLSVAVDLRYRFDSAVVVDQPVKLHLAAIPRVAGTNFTVSIRKIAGLDVANGGLVLEKVDASGVYRQEMTLIRRASAPDSIRVLVTMDVPEGAGFGFFSIPLDGGKNPQKSDSVKPH